MLSVPVIGRVGILRWLAIMSWSAGIVLSGYWRNFRVVPDGIPRLGIGVKPSLDQLSVLVFWVAIFFDDIVQISIDSPRRSGSEVLTYTPSRFVSWLLG